MRQHHDEAYVLRTQALGDADLIVTLFAAHNGKVKGVARSARNSRRRFGGLLEPLTHLRVQWVEKPGRELHRIESAEGVRSFAPMQGDPALQAACAVLAELCETFAREDEPDPKTFDLLGAVLSALEGGLDPWVAVRYFEFWLLQLHGLLPDLDRCSACGRRVEGARRSAEPGVGSFCGACVAEGPTVRLGAADVALLRAARSRPPQELGPHARAARPGGPVEGLLRGTLEGFAERAFRSYRHLRAMTRDASPERGA